MKTIQQNSIIKNTFVAVILFFLFLAADAQAQSSKIGYVDSQYIFSLLPEIKQTQEELSGLLKQAQNETAGRQKELASKYQAYHKNRANKMTHEVAVQTEAALESEMVASNDQTYAKQQEIEQKKVATYALAQDRVRKAIKEVASEKGYSCVLEMGTTLYYNENDNISNLVLKKLGVSPR